MKIKIRFLSVLFFILTLLHSFSFAENSRVWDESYYDRFTADEFMEYEPSNNKIDFNIIDSHLLNAAVFYETNRMRVKHGMKPFIHSAALEKAAFMHSKDMVEQGFFSHDNPYDAKKRTPFQRMALFGVTGGNRAENITQTFGIQYKAGSPIIPPEHGNKLFRDFETGEVLPNHTYNSLAVDMVDGWMNSPGHRANILSVELKYLGCGAFHFEDRSSFDMDMFKATQNFASEVPE